ncbi:MAG: YceI family protein [Crocinitomicaceae bacterium]
MKKSMALVVLSGFLFAACGGGEEETNNEEVTGGEEAVVEESCTYAYDPEETVLTWTAFKLTERVGVSGTFDEINVVSNDGAEDMYAVLTGATFDIPVSSLNSNDEVRDPKIKNSFFGVMDSTDRITGSVNSLSETAGEVSITMNGMTKSYSGDVTVEGEEITFSTTLNMLDFNGQESIDSLGVVCEAKHTGPDGVNKLWEDVELVIRTTLVKTCE